VFHLFHSYLLNHARLCHGGHTVKRLFLHRVNLLPFFIVLLQLSSCSWVSSKRSLFGSLDESNDTEHKTVSRAEYNALAKKYESLLNERKRDNVKGTEVNTNKELQQNLDSDEVAKKIEGVKTELAETVDVFKQNPPTTRKKVSQQKSKGSSDGEDTALIEDHIAKIRKAERLLSEKKYDAAINIIKKLGHSSVKQVAVRARFLMGEVLFTQGDYDLAMQLFEEVLTKNAFSGIVIKTLGRLIVCAEKLKIPDKQERYYSILHDFFERGAS